MQNATAVCTQLSMYCMPGHARAPTVPSAPRVRIQTFLRYGYPYKNYRPVFSKKDFVYLLAPHSAPSSHPRLRDQSQRSTGEATFR
jgi:hypothetical protein